MDIHRISNGDNNYGALINAFSFSFSELLAEMAVCAERSHRPGSSPQAGEATWTGTGSDEANRC